MTLIPWHFDTTLFAICCFFVAFLACTAGLFSNKFLENWLQHIGMILVGIASAMKMLQLFERHYTSPETAMLALGVALFSVGVVWKVWWHTRAEAHDWHETDRRKAERRGAHDGHSDHHGNGLA